MWGDRSSDICIRNGSFMTLEEVRRNIDRVDGEIKRLFKERMELADNVARVKAETGDVIYKPDREEVIINTLTADVDDNIKREYTALIKRIMEVSRKYQYGRTLELRDCFPVQYEEHEPKLKITAMLDREVHLCDEDLRASVVVADTFEGVAELINNGSADCGMGVIEDIGYGVSDALHDILTGNGLYICRCKVVNEDGHKKKLVTFSEHLAAEEEHNRIKIMFVCKNHSGSLGSVLSMIADYGVNLTEIHSVPYTNTDWNYRIYAELNANFRRKDIKALIFQLINETEEFKVLGSYCCNE